MSSTVVIRSFVVLKKLSAEHLAVISPLIRSPFCAVKTKDVIQGITNIIVIRRVNRSRKELSPFYMISQHQIVHIHFSLQADTGSSVIVATDYAETAASCRSLSTLTPNSLISGNRSRNHALMVG